MIARHWFIEVCYFVSDWTRCFNSSVCYYNHGYALSVFSFD